MYIHNLFETEQLNEGVLDLIKSKLGFLNHLHGIDKYKTDKPVEHFEKKSQELLHKIDDPKLQNVVTKFIHKGIKHPKYQAVIIAILMAFIARTSLEFSHRMGLTPAQTTYLLEAIMPGMANLVYQLMNGGSWRQSIEAAVMSSAAGVGAASAANAAFSTVEEGDQFSQSAAFRQHASGEKGKRNFKSNELQNELGHEQNIEAQIPFDVYINGRKWKTFPTESHARNIARKLVLKGKDATVKITPLKSNIEEHIVKVKGGYELKSKHGNKNLGKYPTRSGAEKRERQVQYFKHATEGVAEGYWQDAVKKAEASREARKGKPFEKNPASHDKQDVYKGDKDLAGRLVPKRKEQGVAEEYNSANIVSAEQVWDYISRIHPKDQQGGGFLKTLIMLHPQYELRRVPLSSLHIPNDEDDGNDPYGRAMFVDVDHTKEYSQYQVDKKPLVIDSQGHILDGGHRAWAAAELLNKKDIMAYVPVKNRPSTPQDLEIRKKFTNQNVSESSSVAQEIKQFINSLTPDDVGVEEFPGYRVHFEGFTDDCQLSSDYQQDPDAVYQQVYQDFVDREGGAQPVQSGMAGSEEYPVLYSVFRVEQGVAEEKLNELDMFAPVTTFIKMTDGSYVQADWRRSQGNAGFSDSASFINFKPVNPTVAKQLGLDSNQSNTSISNPRTGTIASGGDYQSSLPISSRRYEVVDYNKPETMEKLPDEIKPELIKWIQKQGVAEGSLNEFAPPERGDGQEDRFYFQEELESNDGKYKIELYRNAESGSYAVSFHRANMQYVMYPIDGIDAGDLADGADRYVKEIKRNAAHGSQEDFVALSSADLETFIPPEQGVAEGQEYQVKKVFKDKAGYPVGEIGIDPESSPGNGEWYVYHYGTGYSVVGFDSAAEAKRELLYVHKHPDAVEGHPSTKEQGVAEEWSQKYKSSINCSHPKGFSQKAHCAGKKKHEESMMTMEEVCPNCGMCQTHGNLNEIKKGAKDSNGFTKCWPGKHAEGTKKGKNGGQVRNCVPNEGVAENYHSDLMKQTYAKFFKPAPPKTALAVKKFLSGVIISLGTAQDNDYDEEEPEEISWEQDLADVREAYSKLRNNSSPNWFDIADAVLSYDTEFRESMLEWAEEELGNELVDFLWHEVWEAKHKISRSDGSYNVTLGHQSVPGQKNDRDSFKEWDPETDPPNPFANLRWLVMINGEQKIKFGGVGNSQEAAMKTATNWANNHGYEREVQAGKVKVVKVQQGLAEGGMPSSVIKSKQRYSDMSDKDFAELHQSKSDDDLKSMAWRHGHGKGSLHYVNKRKRGLARVEESRLYYNVIGTRNKDLKESFGMQQDQRGWYIKASAGRKSILEAHKAFGAPILIK